MAEHVIEMQNVSCSFDDLVVLEDVNLTVSKDDFLAVIGPNGGGKSTLLKLMLGLLEPTAGTVRLLGKAPGSYGSRVGYLPQHTHVADSFPITVLDAVRMGMIGSGLRGVTRFGALDEETKKARIALERVDMLSLEKRSLAGLSGGQKQRVFIARALVDLPEILFLDEPTASVDPSSRNALFRLLGELNTDMTIIMVSHDVSSLASGVKSVACVNRTLHFHEAPKITGEMFRMGYGDGEGDVCCPVELVTHGHVPHRVLGKHDKGDKA